jgi:hypothetical protein
MHLPFVAPRPLRFALALGLASLSACDVPPGEGIDGGRDAAGHADVLVLGDASEPADAPVDVGTPTDAPSFVDTATSDAAPPDAGVDDRPLSVVVLGSSTAAGKNLDVPMYGGEATLTNSWAHRYDRHLAATHPGSPAVVNLAVAGYSTWSVLPTGTVIPTTFMPGTGRPDPMRNVTHAISLSPDVILVNFPSGGDLSDGYTPAQVVANLEAIRDAAAEAGIPVWVTTSSPTNDVSPSFVAATRELNRLTLEAFPDHTIDFYAARAAPDGSPLAGTSLTDALPHPNAEGHRLLFEAAVAARVLERL